ncbi:ribose-phosphate diphosphokinase [Roseateles oligotrophus]|uniref:ribose-phosphate diphosphokinase n=1 Tax=Roseateles oligotrophus TaxID=1769250 RepID=A0ABT2YML2_9BURK|nr:ribose-phosphate diphosphokinase [Roseateles oligotrophus]MCV2371310.1 ribose-phosphate diphosphokinase [Roseateles oligotrophus]
MLLYSLEANCTFAQNLATALDATLAPHEERAFPDGESKLRPLSDPRGADCYVLLSLHGGPVNSPHDKLCRLLMFIATLRDHGAARVSAVLPYFAYARKDQRTKSFDPLSLRYVAQLFEAVGVAQVIVLEAHNVAAFENAFSCPTQHLSAHQAFNAAVEDILKEGGREGHTSAPLAVVSPDPGGVKRVQLWREALELQLQRSVQFAMIDKRRSAGLLGGSQLVAGDVEGATVLLLDDLIASGETLQRSAKALQHAGAKRVIAFAAHGLFVGDAPQILMDAALARIVITDSVPPFRLPSNLPVRGKVQIASSVPLFAQAIRDSSNAWWR